LEHGRSPWRIRRIVAVRLPTRYLSLPAERFLALLRDVSDRYAS
jgi:hypothetical protein